MPFLPTPTLDIEYEEHGSPTGPPVLLLHGFPDCKAAWQGVVELLLADGGPTPRLVVPNLRGYGETRLKPGNAPTGQQSALAADIFELMDALGIARALLVGHDWGARASYAAAILAPGRVQAVVALATAYAFPAGEVPTLEQAHCHWYQFLFQQEAGEDALRRSPAAFGEYLWQAWSPTWHYTPAELTEAQAAWTQPDYTPTVLGYYRARFGNTASPPQYAGAQSKLEAKPPVPVPVVFVQGGADRCDLPASSEGLEQFCPGGLERIDLPGIGHFIPREAPHETAALVRRALDKYR